MLYGCVEGSGLGCAGCLGAAYPSHYNPYTGEKIEGLGILPPPAYVTAPPGQFMYYQPQPPIGKGVSFFPQHVGSNADQKGVVGEEPFLVTTGEKITTITSDVTEKQLAVMPETKPISGKTVIAVAAAIAIFVGYRNWKKR